MVHIILYIRLVIVLTNSILKTPLYLLSYSRNQFGPMACCHAIYSEGPIIIPYWPSNKSDLCCILNCRPNCFHNDLHIKSTTVLTNSRLNELLCLLPHSSNKSVNLHIKTISRSNFLNNLHLASVCSAYQFHKWTSSTYYSIPSIKLG